MDSGPPLLSDWRAGAPWECSRVLQDWDFPGATRLPVSHDLQDERLLRTTGTSVCVSPVCGCMSLIRLVLTLKSIFKVQLKRSEF